MRLYLAQRISAVVMAPLVLGHIVVMIYAVRGGLSAGEILLRTQGSLWWGLYYTLFVVAVSVHASIGIRTIVHEYLKLSGLALEALTVALGALLLAMGGRAVVAVVF